MGAGLVVFDPTVFERTAMFLLPAMVASHLQTIAELGEDLLRELRRPDALIHARDELAETAHILAGSAGMLGFGRVAALGRCFERAVLSGAAEVAGFADSLSAALEATLQEIRHRMSVAVSAGLGLAISARLAALMSGRCDNNDTPGGGNVFWLELPLGSTTAPCPATTPTPDARDDQPALTTARALQVLVVDDISMNRDIAAAFLRAAGHKITCADCGTVAIAAAAITDFDVVLMDVGMPEMNGLAATRRIRALEGARGRVPIVALSAQAFAERVAECRAAGMNDHLTKPFDPDTLLAAVARATAAGQRQGESVGPATPPTAPVIAMIGAKLPPFDREAFEGTAFFLAPGAVASCLQTIAERGAPLLRGVWGPGPLLQIRRELAEVAHNLAGSAGMLGFDRLAALGRRFEKATESAAAEAPPLADALSAALQITLQEIRTRTTVTLGAGLSLAISARLAALMGGYRGYDDNPVGGQVVSPEMPLPALKLDPTSTV